MSPSPRNRSQERSTFRQGPPARDRMDIDHYEPPGHAATRSVVPPHLQLAPLTSGRIRRRRLSDPQAISDSKRRRIDVPGPAPPGIDRYVPDHSKSSRMDLDAPIPRQDNSLLLYFQCTGLFLIAASCRTLHWSRQPAISREIFPWSISSASYSIKG